MKSQSLKKTDIVSKSNYLNEMRCTQMTIQEQKFLDYYLAKINSMNAESRVVHISLKKYKELMGLKKLNINSLMNSAERLLQKVVRLKVAPYKYDLFQLFKKCRIQKDEDDEWCLDIDAHDDALPYFFEYQNNFFTYKLCNVIKINSPNAKRMYDILKQHQKQSEYTFSLDELRELLFIEKNQYPRYNSFRERILLPAQKELSENTDIKFAFEPITKGRKVTHIKFVIRTNPNYSGLTTAEEFQDIQEEQDTELDGQLALDFTEVETSRQELEQIKTFENENLEFLSEACNGEFDEKQMDILKSYLVKLVPFDNKTYQTDQYDYLLSKYKELNYRANRQDLAPLKNRFAYLKSILEVELKNIGAEDETKW